MQKRYLVEWVRDEILQRNFHKFFELFPASVKLSAKDKWREVPKKLVTDGQLKGRPNLESIFWTNWLTLVDYRDGLIHAVSSRPSGTCSAPLPSIDKLAALKPGWAVNIAIELITTFHAAAGIEVPDWLKKNAEL